MAVVIVVVIVVVVLAIVPVPRSTSQSWGDTLSGGQYTNLDAMTLCPGGAHATLTYSSDGIDSSTVVLAPGGAFLQNSTASAWTIHFTLANCEVYTFYTNATGTGSYSYTLSLSFNSPLL